MMTVERLISDWTAPLPPFCYRAFVDDAPLPSRVELSKEFYDEDSVSEIFDGRPFIHHPSCIDADMTPGVKMFWIADPPQIMLDDHEKIITWACRQNLGIQAKRIRPATPREARAFAKAFPTLQQQIPIVVLGAWVESREKQRLPKPHFAMVRRYPKLSVASSRCSRRVFSDERYYFGYLRLVHFLFVCEAS